jgi:nucleotide-binding universal stress UspA family protein
MRRILVGFDGSEGSEKALNKAMMLIEENGKLILLAVIPVPSDKNLVDQTAFELLKKKASNMIGDAIKDVGQHDYEINGIVEEGNIAAKIIDVANDLNCDLIVLGSLGSSELGSYPIGSIANKVVQYAHKPVMVVR